MSVNVYSTPGDEADDVAELIAELHENCVEYLAYCMLQPNPRLELADNLEEVAAGVDVPEERARLLRAVAYLRGVT